MHLSTLALPLLAASVDAQLHKLAKQAGLKYFGAATDTPGFRERAGLEAAYEQYNAIRDDTNEFGQTTPTNGQKWLFTEPERGVFNFTEGDVVADIAENNGQILRCHALVWHSQLAPWVEQGTWTAEEVEQIIVDHITNVAGYYKGKCYAWDVVNEALEEDGSYRKSVFYNALGEDYIKLAFKTAAEVDPTAKLYYNDYNLESPSPKSRAAVNIVKMLQAEGIKIDGIGMQAHLVADRAATLDDQIAVIESYAATGVEVAYTELDVRLFTPNDEEKLALQKEVYRNSTGACVQTEACVGITLWDFYDPFSWVPYVFEGEGDALLWFEDFEKHPAYDGVVEALTNGTKPCKPGKGRGKGKGKGHKRSNKLF
ncbi:related to endo-1,4-beta-xylanase [Cephalotrichum gorgonifer]|uniref:Beta-xylanase n=1 Tax=Cephalotrichum gorgonifer TaxID=2041049 RepID=A0AAE8SX30_9PEZI|nr:related to endo-1,4-beta-xylanase [Cephalotrichum gorgonifer]